MAKATSSSSRKPATNSKSKSTSTASKSKAKKGQASDEDEEMQEGSQGEGEEVDLEEADEEDNQDDPVDATVIAETQFEGAGGKGSKGKKAPPKKVVAKSSGAGEKRKAKAELTRDGKRQSGDDEGGDSDEPTAREKKLQAKLEAKSKDVEEIKAAFTKLSELRHTRAEEAEARLKSLADERLSAAQNTVAVYKKEADTLRAENAALQNKALASPRTKAAQASNTRIQELEQLYSETLAKVEELGKEAEERESYWRNKLELELKAGENAWNLERTQLAEDLETAQKDYSTEVAHSKSLQAKLKSLGPTSSSSSLPAASANVSSSASSAKLAQITEERDLAIQKLQLNEDLTGFTVHSLRGGEEPTYVCSLVDCWGTDEKSLNFKIQFYRDSTVGYTPDIEPSRDELLTQILAPELQKYVRFQADQCGEFFKKLYFAVNKRR
ncbi:hypothetical protein JCM5353_005320 [Sporobolomyces roseus]